MRILVGLLAVLCAFSLDAAELPSLEELKAAESVPRIARERLGRGGLAGLLDAPAGKRGFVTVDPVAQRLVFEDGTPARFYGICHNAYVNQWSEPVPQAHIERMVDEMAFLGINLVRMFSIANSIDHGTFSEALNPVAIDNRDRFIAAAAERGIYIHLNICKPTSNSFENALGTSHTVNLVAADTVLEARKRFTTALLTHVNPHRGLAYKDDPAIIAVQLGNEIHAYSRGWGGRRLGFADWSNMAEPYNTEMVERWQAFLRDKYKNREALAKAWGELLAENEDPVAGTVALTNPAYPKWFDDWLPDARQQDAIAFGDSLQRRFYQLMRAHIRGLGDRHLLSDNGWIRGSDLIFQTAAENLDIMDVQHYWPHLTFKRLPQPPTPRSPLKDLGPGMLESLLTARGTPDIPRPGFVTEYSSHIDSGHAGEVYPVHSLLSQLVGIDGVIAWVYWPTERYWEHWFAINQQYSPLPERLIPFMASAMLWRQDIPAGDLAALRETIAAYNEAKAAEEDTSIDRDGATSQAIVANAGPLQATPEWLTVDFQAGLITAHQPTWELFVGTGEAKGPAFGFIPADPEARYTLAAFALDHRPLSESTRIRLFATTPGILTCDDGLLAYPCDRQGRVLRMAEPVRGCLSVRDVQDILYYDLERPVTTDSVTLASNAWIAQVTTTAEHYGGNTTDRLIDGSLQSGFMGAKSETPLPHDLILTLDQPRTVQLLRLYCLGGLQEGPSQVELYASSDGETWNHIAASELSWYHWAESQGLESHELRFKPIEAKFLRLSIRDVNMGWNGYRLQELEVE